MEILCRFALNKNRVRTFFQYGVHGHDVGLAKVLECVYEGAVALQPLVPPAKLRGKGRRNKNFVNWRVEANPGKTTRKSLGVIDEQFGPIRVLKISDPVRHAEVA